jgi:PTH1 family peptidyl-tRNA hydrolase
MWLIVGLGNPGEQYSRTRHNIGFACLNALAKRHGLEFAARRSHARIAEGRIAGQRVALARPTTYMNLSGKAVVALRNWYKVEAAEALLVIYDDMDLPFGKLRLRQRGSAGTHNGMRSIVQLLGTQEFPRLRVGIGSPPAGWDAKGYVLGRFSKDEEAELPTLYDQVSDAIEVVVREGLVMAMNRYNR